MNNFNTSQPITGRYDGEPPPINHWSNKQTNPFRQITEYVDKCERELVQRQINERVAQIIRLTREVQDMTACRHAAVSISPWSGRRKCAQCNARLD